jgi:hypothetical protein
MLPGDLSLTILAAHHVPRGSPPKERYIVVEQKKWKFSAASFSNRIVESNGYNGNNKIAPELPSGGYS